jgi:hypothetical protein
MNIQPIVEGHGEVPAVPVLLRRLRDEGTLWQIDVNPPIRRRRNELVQEHELRRAVQLALLQENCGAILILFDSDRDCPKELAPQLQAWAQDEAGRTPCGVVMAHKEYESWFLATVESLRGQRGIREDAVSHPEPETPRGAKSHLEDRMHEGRSYMERADQPALTAVFDLQTAFRRCRSFRKFTTTFGELVRGMSFDLANWPPLGWEEDS